MDIWETHIGEGPLVATAIHDGHALREEVMGSMKLPNAGRLREEDPFTGEWARLLPSYIVAKQSRFEVDLNRPLDEAVYREPADAWGLDMWRAPLSDAVVNRSREQHVSFYAHLHEIYAAKAKRHGKFVVLDLHSYNHRRDGPDGAAADPQANPEVNIGTGTMDRSKWAPLIDRFIADLHAADYQGQGLDVRENVKFVGRRHGEFAHTTFPDSACVMSVEFKKIFMDEWSGELDQNAHAAIGRALSVTFPGLIESLRQLGANL